MKTNDGGPAFPVEDKPENYLGMTLRDWFAGQALAGTIAGLNGLSEETATLVNDAYMIADAMLAARETKKEA